MVLFFIPPCFPTLVGLCENATSKPNPVHEILKIVNGFQPIEPGRIEHKRCHDP
ncbi:hypothetical protein HanXRQr2_Chr17g0810001 [Helianthus annuus]|uniref:Uncharacterized protein n=1 Tax=Helianthus annuus TaxID=4232 RepID=A0A9K3DKU8_HELAN|nr:hypothetical protein HanXRQr2_Chr17g0810001 [Helianthus annuus]KAJ0813761.1 hypothetical protein HanPSC8_Chr17g0777371 [Helianthus annuus]